MQCEKRESVKRHKERCSVRQTRKGKKMKRRLIHTLGFIASAMFAFAASPAAAQTTANGPYYATPSWDQKLQCDTQATCPRFIVLSNWGSAAVLDRETGLVWEKSPDATPSTWLSAQDACVRKNVGGRRGWKLPSIQELASLVDGDPANTSSPRLPPGHPFTNVQADVYWSATTNASSTTTAWFVFFGIGNVGRSTKFDQDFAWCVRGGPGGDPQ